MPPDTIIHVEHLSKKYLIRHQRRDKNDGLRHVLHDTLLKPFRNLAKIGKSKTATAAKSTEDFWALRDVSFEVKQGDVLGIIGRNGAGKSTLLKVLSRITESTSGRIGIKGRVASLLEVGTGFHPELTGRENIFLNGAILGMSRSEIREKFDEIVAFAEVEKFLDTPVKRYSSGMYVRLAFAVAAHLEPEILVVDEVLAVGDAEFQKKCLGKMHDVATQQGRTVLFVSHNESAVRRLCTRAMLMEKGRSIFMGTPSEAFQKYKENRQSFGFSDQKRIHQSPDVRIKDASLRLEGMSTAEFLAGDQPQLEILVEVSTPMTFSIEVLLRDADSSPIMFAPLGLSQGFNRRFEPGLFTLSLVLKFPILAEGAYSLDLIICESNVRFFDYVEDGLVFTIAPSNNQNTGWVFRQARGQGCMLLETTAPEIHAVNS